MAAFLSLGSFRWIHFLSVGMRAEEKKKKTMFLHVSFISYSGTLQCNSISISQNDTRKIKESRWEKTDGVITYTFLKFKTFSNKSMLTIANVNVSFLDIAH